MPAPAIAHINRICTALPPKGTPALKAGNSTAALATAVPGRLPIQDAARNFAQVIARVEPIAESLCRSQPGLRNCDFQIWVDTDAELPPNAYQTLDQSGRHQRRDRRRPSAPGVRHRPLRRPARPVR